MPKIDAFLRVMREEGASDLHLSAGSPPVLRVNGDLQEAQHRALTDEEVRLLVYELLTEGQVAELERRGELDCAHTVEGSARFRIHAYKKHPGMAAAFRVIPHEIPTLDSLGLPDVIREMLANRSGLILVTGPTNSGKSTTLAAMVDYLNEHMNHHILTLEDPLEFIHSNKRCLINQRQVGEHSLTFADALRGALRADPNVILVGEMRDLDTISMALTAAELGLLVMGTLHTKSAAQTISRVVDAFPVDQQQGVRVAMSEVLVGVVSQQLLRRKDGEGRVAAHEILVSNQAVRTMIRESKTHQVPNVITTGRKEGMVLLDQSLRDLVSEGVVTPEEAALFAQEPMALLSMDRESAAPASPPAR
ncbi:MAG: type IV pilus twitching motility protein PilT [Gemmatimonadetes bacterium]|nr:type IV pilus twitching motility protein PilT [Gemmatimonadota bacterium]NNM34329.1 type IV pilus twitching motility protein PilT [Gemmatimonadota bacterium]